MPFSSEPSRATSISSKSFMFLQKMGSLDRPYISKKHFVQKDKGFVIQYGFVAVSVPFLDALSKPYKLESQNTPMDKLTHVFKHSLLI